MLAVLAPLVLPAGFQGVPVDRAVGEGVRVAHGSFARDHVDAHPADARGGPGEIFVDKFMAQADGLKNLRAAVALDGGDAHLGDDFDHALDHRLGVIVGGFVVVDPGQQALADHFFDRGVSQVGVDRHRAIADQHGKMMHFARLARFDHQADLGARAVADQVMVQAGDRQQGRDGGVVLVDAAVREDDDIGLVVGDHLVDPRIQVFQGLFQARRRLQPG